MDRIPPWKSSNSVCNLFQANSCGAERVRDVELLVLGKRCSKLFVAHRRLLSLIHQPTESPAWAKAVADPLVNS